MAGALEPFSAAYADAVRALERSLADTRAQWDDPTRRAFDSRHALVIIGDAKTTLVELERLAAELTAATKALDGSA